MCDFNSIQQESLKPFFWAFPISVKLTVSIKRRQQACRMAGAANSVYSMSPLEPLRIKACSQRSGTTGEFGSLLIHSPYTYRLRGRSRLVFRSAQSLKWRSPAWGGGEYPWVACQEALCVRSCVRGCVGGLCGGLEPLIREGWGQARWETVVWGRQIMVFKSAAILDSHCYYFC